ncbi:hypothetical protein, partial [Clostridioides difficile]|uniref:hypothetical protein n=1 Tax=Clostridioides difficile TaxID=1496 RepID=UPI00210BDBBE
ETLQAGASSETRRSMAQTLLDLANSDEMQTLLPVPLDIMINDDDFENVAPTEYNGSLREKDELDTIEE